MKSDCPFGYAFHSTLTYEFKLDEGSLYHTCLASQRNIQRLPNLVRGKT
jgi:hypothetical protein